jgi:hypothetical protein
VKRRGEERVGQERRGGCCVGRKLQSSLLDELSLTLDTPETQRTGLAGLVLISSAPQ